MKLFSDSGVWSHEANMIAGAFSNLSWKVQQRLKTELPPEFGREHLRAVMISKVPQEAMELPLVLDKGYDYQDLLLIWQQAVRGY